MTAESLAAMFKEIAPHLDERQRRLVMGAQARALGHGGGRFVARAAGVRESTVSLGVSELKAGAEPLGRARRPGGGRSGHGTRTRGWCRRCWRWWIRRSGATRNRRCGGRSSPPGRWLRSWPGRAIRPARTRLGTCCARKGSACRAPPRRSRESSTRTGTPSSGTSAAQAEEHMAAGQPVISVDAKKKEQIGLFATAGPPVAAPGEPGQGARPRLPRRGAGRGDPVRDLRPGRERWLGERRAPTMTPRRSRWNRSAAGGRPGAARTTRRARRLLITADAGGSNGYRTRAVEGRAGRAGRRDRAGDHRAPLPARHLEVEQGGAPAVLVRSR